MPDPADDVATRAERSGTPVAAYVLAAGTYVVLGVVTRTVFLNWIVGPLYFVVAVLAFGALLDRAGAGGRRV